jgi:glutamate--cysteine ligase
MTPANAPSLVPDLCTAQVGPPHAVERQLLENAAAIETWLRDQWRLTPAPFYTSVDVRNANFKVAPVDTNLFPAGFNNLNPAFRPLLVQAVQSALERYPQTVRRVLLIPENHTRNLHYFESVATLAEALELAGCELRIGSISTELELPMTVTVPSGRELLLEKVERVGDRLRVGGFEPCLVLLNNDLSGGRPPILEGISQVLTPPLGLGWSNRLKSDHFRHYMMVAQGLAATIGLDPWFIDPLFRNCGEVDFMKSEGLDCLQTNVAGVIREIAAKYREYGIEREPFVFVKADSGTYGMGVMAVRGPEELAELNRKQRTRMASSKEGQPIRNVIIQEGVYTEETWGPDRAVAEPVVYMVDHHVVGGFYRVHTDRSPTENLNAPGMRFEPLAFADTCNCPDRNRGVEAHINRFYAYGVIGRLAALAAARERAALFESHPTSAVA